MPITEEEKNRRAQEKASLLDFFYECIVELEGIVIMGLGWDDAVASALLDHGWDLVAVE